MTCTELKRWAVDADWQIVKTRDESDGEIAFEMHYQGRFDDASDTLEGARAQIRGQKNQAALDEVYDRLGDLDLEAKGTAAKLAAILKFLEK